MDRRKQFDGLTRFLANDTDFRKDKAAFLWRMRKINGHSSEVEIQEKLRWLRGLGKPEQIQKLLREQDESRTTANPCPNSES